MHDIEDSTASAEVTYHVSAYDVIRAGRVVDHIGAEHNHYDLSLVMQPGGGWIIANVFDLEG